MTKVTIHQAKTHLSKLIAEVLAGGEVIIAKGQEPVVRLVPVNPVRKPRKPGALRGQIDIGPEFFEPLPEIEISAWDDPV